MGKMPRDLTQDRLNLAEIVVADFNRYQKPFSKIPNLPTGFESLEGVSFP
jgi:hypothetical protein